MSECLIAISGDNLVRIILAVQSLGLAISRVASFVLFFTGPYYYIQTASFATAKTMRDHMSETAKRYLCSLFSGNSFTYVSSAGVPAGVCI